MAKIKSSQRFHPRLLLLALLLVLPAFGLVLYANLAQRRSQAAAVTASARALAELAAANEQDIIKDARQLLGTLSQFPFLVLSTNRASGEWHLGNLLKLSPDYVNFGIIESNGDLFCSGATTNVAANLGDRSYFRRVIGANGFAIGDFQTGRLTRQSSLNFGYPVRDEQGRLTRVLFSSLRLSRLSESISHISLPEGGVLMIVDSAGQVLAQQPNPDGGVGKSLGGDSVVKRILRHNEPVFTMADTDGIRRLHATTVLKDAQAARLFVCVSIPLTVSMAQANRTLFVNCAILALVAIGVLVGGWLYSRRYFLRPVDALVRAANALAAGNLQARTGPIFGAAELVQLGAAFNEMAQRLGDRQSEMLKLNQELRAEIAERKRAEEQVRQQAEAQRKLEAQLFRSQRMESLGALAGGIAHDLNNALAPILMGSDLLRETAKGNPDELGFLDLITTSARRCVQMVKQILNFAKGAKSQQGSIRMNHLLREMAALANDTFPKSIIIESEYSKGLFTVWGDATELHQVLMNLCVNSRDAMPNGGRLVLKAENHVVSSDDIRPTTPEVSPGQYVAISVTDTGGGIPDEIRARIFEPFFTTKSPDKGTGLGLSTVAQIVKKHHGVIQVESQAGKGTTFRIFLPAEQMRPIEEPQPDALALPAGRGELILVVDDEELVLALARTTLENYGYRVVTARNGLEAIACFEPRKNEVKLVLTDNDMPLSDGLQAVQAIQKINPGIPIIVASGVQSDTQWFSRVDRQRVTVMGKPYGVDQLLRAVAALLDGARPAV
ncbi:MAG: ATP-binding protein [Limisphaerales bacterium]